MELGTSETIERILINESQLQAKVAELANQISIDYEGKNPLFVGILKEHLSFFQI